MTVFVPPRTLAPRAADLVVIWRRWDFAFVLGGTAVMLALALLAAWAAHRGPPQPWRQAARIADGEWGAKALARLAGPHEALFAARVQRPWTPPGPLGWPRYDLARLPQLGLGKLDQDEARRLNALIPVSPLPILTLGRFVLPNHGTAERARALQCLSQAVYFEAGFEPGEGQRAVAQVVLNRLRHPAYPKSVCGVVYQGAQRGTGCQFSFTCDGSLLRPMAPEAWARAQDVARQALAGYVYKPVGTATHYHAAYVFPYWAVTLVKLRQIGAHIFYRMTGPSGRPGAFTDRYVGGELSLPASVLSGGDTLTPDAPSPSQGVVVNGDGAPRTVTLDLAGEVHTYTVADPDAPGGVRARVAGEIQPSRPQPTPDQVREINEKLSHLDDPKPVVPEPPPPPSTAAPEPHEPKVVNPLATRPRQSRAPIGGSWP